MNQFNLPQATILNRKLKTHFEKNIKNGRKLLSDIKTINLIHKLSEDTINIPITNTVKEILIFEITLSKKEIPKELLKNIVIPDIPVLFVLKYEEHYSYAISLLNEQKYYFTSFNEVVEFNFNDTNLEKVYQNIVKKFLKNVDASTTLNFKQTIQLEQKMSTLIKEIQALENKIKKEKQFKKQLELSRELKPKQQELQNLQKDRHG